MPTFSIDFRFVEIGAELEALSDSLRTVEEQLAFLHDQRRTQRFAQIREVGAESHRDEVDLAFHELALQEHAYVKTFRGGFVVTLWAVYESALHEVARFIQCRKNIQLRPSDLRGQNVIQRLKKYFAHVLAFELHGDDTDWAFLEALYAVRNGIAHANGRLAAMNETTKGPLERLCSEDIGVELRMGDVILTEAFARRAFQTVEGLVRDLVRRAREWDDYTRQSPERRER